MPVAEVSEEKRSLGSEPRLPQMPACQRAYIEQQRIFAADRLRVLRAENTESHRRLQEPKPVR